ncbi:hypothetical protein SGQ44_05720 [Flavobacterium sp. Fl-77]|uniref:DUF8201 domain-containing protein n=1 Tax=Flavobacterium flavipigmentatum TaxID=2893884 RepID=A0AAJ2SFB4_9FLAO|nr:MULTISPECIES: hypothetical protein [unclassified Flavobacterium]MDX6181722.1 hypothetical protein [Flavobacterium sp. Fl-33]MDX6185244.1 hypothetical protein [Flavobacterium sp. Fl-77]UFH37350.1 hypothetical protein LNP22_11450 [Flavobacterium sp. F-70]
MVAIFISWIYILFTTVNLGFLTDKILLLKNRNLAIYSLLGLFLTTILASIWAIFGRINIEFHLFLLLLNIGVFCTFRTPIIDSYRLFFLAFRQWQKTLKVVFVLLTFLIIAQCSSVPYVIDNESYYIQTIKWLNEYGFVKGLINLHLFFSQTSGWHIAQSVFNFSFLYANFNDLSGYCLFVGILFSVEKLNEFYKNGNKNYLIIGLFPLFSIFYFQFISAPSPDIPVYVLSFILFFYFIENFKNTSPAVFNLMVILSLFTLYIKNTALILALLPLVLLLNNAKTLSKNLLKPFLIAVLFLALFLIKNMIICGTPVFPSQIFDSFATDYAIPNHIEKFYYEQFKVYGFFVYQNQYDSMSALDLFLRWLSLPKLNGLFNKIAVLLLIITPVFIYKFQHKKSVWMLYLLIVLQMVFLFVTSPQYRFFMNFILFFSVFCLASFIQKRKTIHTFFILSLLPTIIVLFVPFNLNRFSNHKFMLEISTFSAENALFPHENSKYKLPFTSVRLGNFSYNSPKNCDFFWANGNGELPCVNKDQVEYFRKYFYTIPQMRTKDLKDGFYAKKLLLNE